MPKEVKKSGKLLNSNEELIKKVEQISENVNRLEKEVIKLKSELANRTFKNSFKKFIRSKYFYYGLIILGSIMTFLIFDVALRFMGNRMEPFYRTKSLSPFLFSLSYILILLVLIFFCGNKKGRYLYGAFVLFFSILTFAEIVHANILDRFFKLTDLFSAGEGLNYASVAISSISFKTILVIFLPVIISIFVIYIMGKVEYPKTNYKQKILIILIVIFCVLGLRNVAIWRLGAAVPENQWDSNNYPRNVYDSFVSPNRSMEVSGLYEYTFRNIYKFVEKKLSVDIVKDREVVASYFEERNEQIQYQKNDYSNIFEDKNIIMIMLESIDNRLINDEIMPTLSYLKKTGLNFTNRYAPMFGSGATFNSEFSALTGLHAPTDGTAAFNYDTNNYDLSLPNLFKQNGYTVNSVHMNYGGFYNREGIHRAIGFENHYALKEIYPDVETRLDSTLAENDNIYHLLVPESDKFMTFIITYTPHMPYDNTNPMFQIIKGLDDSSYEELKTNEEDTTVISVLARETDDFLTILKEKLEKDHKIDDTVIVIFSDHGAYNYSKNIPSVSNEDFSKLSLLQSIPMPLIIWSKDIENQQIDIVMDTVDITPTIANMFGLSYTPSYYLGTDVFSKYHESYVYFNDYSWYDGNIYYKGEMLNGVNPEYIKKISEEVNKKIDINDKILSSDYFSTINE